MFDAVQKYKFEHNLKHPGKAVLMLIRKGLRNERNEREI